MIMSTVHGKSHGSGVDAPKPRGSTTAVITLTPGLRHDTTAPNRAMVASHDQCLRSPGKRDLPIDAKNSISRRKCLVLSCYALWNYFRSQASDVRMRPFLGNQASACEVVSICRSICCLNRSPIRADGLPNNGLHATEVQGRFPITVDRKRSAGACRFSA